ncbi:nitroreductase [Alkalihalobacillus alcalophilus ATCC 27647 = CGMCC 1.3604]|uniref:Nitroreductase n=1 Tax=Alkalihalobacillus alcalophilus ATCC 27647 = CGMCC 1.3604 TaxID=1218173 RepID=A0A094WKF9_ALKAL|nr:nitroreductase family protein [Alkalihalobacillus alcalophilus]KGA96438.1 nitroreductase [Alkalihalobacillus alcalophilus ATCC 27647 = CGMCC 1.3604]MED1562864.1 nitroreductase family protein [Alkalihalobacillus alcalophilus]THG90130.1 nitroreductase [Alkalihalobacillus alcalophilus ATCC 27647 = CGMCC 1.3604]
MSELFLKAVEQRRTVRVVEKDSPISDERIIEVVSRVVKHSPTAFNSQSSTVAILFGEQHDTFWQMTKDILKSNVSREQFELTEKKLNGFQSGYGTVLFFDDEEITNAYEKEKPKFKGKFTAWSEQSSGMQQVAVWTALEQEGLAASIQHYNPIVDEKMKEKWDIPIKWRLIAQMPFGIAAENPVEKSFLPIEERVKVFR